VDPELDHEVLDHAEERDVVVVADPDEVEEAVGPVRGPRTRHLDDEPALRRLEGDPELVGRPLRGARRVDERGPRRRGGSGHRRRRRGGWRRRFAPAASHERCPEQHQDRTSGRHRRQLFRPHGPKSNPAPS
jgi:hypothetical protein